MEHVERSGATLLLIDDDVTILDVLGPYLREKGYSVHTAVGGASGLRILEQYVIHVVLLDLKMPDIDGLHVLEAAKRQDDDIEVVILTGHGTIDLAVEAMRKGAYHFLLKPVDTEQLLLVLQHAIEHKQSRQSIRAFATMAADLKPDTTIIAESHEMKKLLAMVEDVAASNTTVLIQGETGTGKERIACRIHERSNRHAWPMFAVNCSAIPENLVESDLFGHEKGAFTGAGTRKRGRFEVANKGTLFLDEVGDLPLVVQPKLLRALEQGEIQRVGDEKILKVDVRIIAATNRDLKKRVADGLFREDLYYRLCVLKLEVQPLRKRSEDIRPLAEQFLGKFAAEMRKKLLGFEPDAMEDLLTYPWPGNVRELENAIERAVLLTKSPTIGATDLSLGG